MKKIWIALVCLIACTSCMAQEKPATKRTLAAPTHTTILPGAYQLDEYVPLLKGKKVAIIGNQTSEINGTLLPDTLMSLGVNLVKLFSPEHGFRGTADAGKQINNDRDAKTNLPIVSLYGNKKTLPVEELRNVDVLIYDLQDVGARFYTYISTLQYAMEAAKKAGITLIILDRPNPLGHIVDGPVLEAGHKSFVGMQPIPIIYGMTPGEYARMLIGEKWANVSNLDLKVIPIKNYDHHSLYHLPVSPSPNLKNMAAIYLYPSLCLFEGTDVSLGRGTDIPFQQYGHPGFQSSKGMTYSFTPRSMQGATNPPQMNKKCYGQLVAKTPEAAILATQNKFNIEWIIKAYQAHPNKSKFFIGFFNTLAGNSKLRQQITAGTSEAAIRKSWEPELIQFKKIRKQYLLYPDFE